MDLPLLQFLRKRQPQAEDRQAWGNGTLPLQIRSYLATEDPPHQYISSVRCLVFQRDQVLVVKNQGGAHILPGGRLELGEGFQDTLRRELLEETGWSVSVPKRLGFMHFHHLNPKPAGYRYPYPDFIQLVYAAKAEEELAQAKLPDDYEISSSFHSKAEVDNLDLSQAEKLFLQAAKQCGHMESP